MAVKFVRRRVSISFSGRDGAFGTGAFEARAQAQRCKYSWAVGINVVLSRGPSGVEDIFVDLRVWHSI